MKQPNIFSQVLKGLRVSLYDTAIALEQADFCEDYDVMSVCGTLNDMLHLFEWHTASEKKYFYPVVEKNEPHLFHGILDSQQRQVQLFQQCKTLMKACRDGNLLKEKQYLQREIMDNFFACMTFSIPFMEEKHQLLDTYLDTVYSTDDLVCITRDITGKFSSREMIVFSSMLLKGMNNAEMVYWLKSARQNAHGLLCFHLLNTAEKEVAGGRWQKILGHIAEGVMLA